jgi:hypothetical protein
MLFITTKNNIGNFPNLDKPTPKKIKNYKLIFFIFLLKPLPMIYYSK